MLSFFLQKKKTATQENFWIEDLKKQPRPKFHTLEIADIKRETDDCVSIAFKVPANLRDEYRYAAGQYVTLKAEIKGVEVRRSYSLCSSPLEDEIRVAVKRVEGGTFSSYANEQLLPGMKLDVMTPQGNFTVPFSPSKSRIYVMFAAGSGITPVMSLIKTILWHESRSRIVLFYGNRSVSSIIFREQIDDLKNEHLNRLEVHHILSREDQGTDWLKGRITADKVRLYAEKFFIPASVNHFFICGPEKMIFEVKDTLEQLGVEESKIHYEMFTVSTAGQNAANDTIKGTKADVLSHVTVILDGEETHFDVSSKGVSILDAALDAGADVPFACKGAVCCTCRAKVLEGKVVMEMNYALEEDELEQGYVLTCQSHPVTERVVISYDD
jgi:ring-1,2-phenylacetyl-CoA epoxidase subunit PaaE